MGTVCEYTFESKTTAWREVDEPRLFAQAFMLRILSSVVAPANESK